MKVRMSAKSGKPYTHIFNVKEIFRNSSIEWSKLAILMTEYSIPSYRGNSPYLSVAHEYSLLFSNLNTV